jgi:GGDEF domain-containing protein
VTELAVWFLALVLVERLVLDGEVGFVGIEPSPYWVPILWFAMWRGLVPALVAVLCASLLYAAGLAAAAGLCFGALLDLELMWQPVTFGVAAFVVGHARDVMAIRYERLRRNHERLHEEVQRRRREVAVLEHAGNELKRRIFDRSFDFTSVMAAVARSGNALQTGAFEPALDMLVEYCGAARCSVLLVLPDGTLDLDTHRGWSEEDKATRIAESSASTQVMRAIVDARPMVAGQGSGGSGRGPLLVAPVADATGVIKALMCIDDIPPDRFTDTTVRTFLGIASWVANSVRRLQLGASPQESKRVVLQVLNSRKLIGTPEDLSGRILIEDQRRIRHGVDSVLVAVRVLDARASMVEYLETMEASLVEKVSAVVRDTDDVFRFGFAGCFVVVLTGCGRKDAAAVVERMDASLRAAGGQNLGQVDLLVFACDAASASLAALLPRIAEHFYASSAMPLDHNCPVPEPKLQRPGNARDFARRLRLEAGLARRFAQDLHIVDFRGDQESVGLGVGPMIARHLFQLVGTQLRVTDGIYVLGPGRCVVILPSTSSLDASRIWMRLDEALRRSVPEERHAHVRADFLALGETELRDAVQFLMGGERAVEPAGDVPILSDVELNQLAFSENELSQFGTGSTFSEAGGSPAASGGIPAAVGPGGPVRFGEALRSILRFVDDLKQLGLDLRDAIPATTSPAATAKLDRLLQLCGDETIAESRAVTDGVPPPSAGPADPWADDRSAPALQPAAGADQGPRTGEAPRT